MDNLYLKNGETSFKPKICSFLPNQGIGKLIAMVKENKDGDHYDVYHQYVLNSTEGERVTVDVLTNVIYPDGSRGVEKNTVLLPGYKDFSQLKNLSNKELFHFIVGINPDLLISYKKNQSRESTSQQDDINDLYLLAKNEDEYIYMQLLLANIVDRFCSVTKPSSNIK